MNKKALERPIETDSRPNSTPNSSSRVALSRFDFVLVALLLAASLMAVLQAVRHPDHPMEDAAMLLRYSEHLAQGHGITWNVGEHPVEGATDFLYMATVAGISKVAGVDVVLSSRLLLSLCWILLPVTVFLATRLAARGPWWLCFVLGLYMAAGPGAWFIRECFSGPMVALAVALAWWVANRLMYDRISIRSSVLFAALCLLLGLIRPEASLLAFFMLLSILFVRKRQALPVAIAFALVFATLGLAYFVWRWRYFGYLLPNPLYVKGGGHLHMDGLRQSIANVIKMLWPLFPVWMLALRSRASVRRLAAGVLPIAFYTVIWIFLSNENNHLMRFQFPVVPLALISLPTMLEHLGADLELPAYASLPIRARASIVGALSLFVLVALVSMQRSFSGGTPPNSGPALASALSQYAGHSIEGQRYTMATTEAGQFPFYSKWNAIDTLALNDAYIAHHGLDAAYLDRYKPELILYHAVGQETGDRDFQSELFGGPRPQSLRGQEIATMHEYALANHYILASAYGDVACNLQFFWIRPDTPDTDALVQLIRSRPYYFLDSGTLSTDLRDNLPTAPCTIGSE